ncbi:hypothetical protein [[Mycobacterium] nativiensis]|uniref:Uncharacterized protein n=1 Tax=[Mycobacterium] nativiensis TaxID=2855503 RepID=A0ABU5XU43_9MYCO|nr:hypothetical protein [Mycolicibacter sp. MYC340]MEB3031504.1 hypothetical protein [Mycolicibacter sp. MYC340]
MGDKQICLNKVAAGRLGFGAGPWVYDQQQWRSAAAAGLTRFLEPFTVSAYVVMAAAVFPAIQARRLETVEIVRTS